MNQWNVTGFEHCDEDKHERIVVGFANNCRFLYSKRFVGQNPGFLPKS